MKCAWQAYLEILPLWLRKDVDTLGKDKLKELRMRSGSPPELVLRDKSVWLRKDVKQEDLDFVLSAASNYSAWAASTMAFGYLTAEGGHRIGVCGNVVTENGRMKGIHTPLSMCIRVAREFPGIAQGADNIDGSVLLIGPPGSGKTTLLREWIRARSQRGPGCISVVDERGEVFPRYQGTYCFHPGPRTDVISGCTKAQGVTCVLKTMTPSCIALDEITSEEDCGALVNCTWNGVDLLATAHASCVEDLYRSEIYKKIVQAGMFQTIIVLDRHQQWRVERIMQ